MADLGFGYTRHTLNRQQHIKRIRQRLSDLCAQLPDQPIFRDITRRIFYQFNRVRWWNSKLPLPYQEFGLVSQTTDYLRDSSSVGLVDIVRLTDTLDQWVSVRAAKETYEVLQDIVALLEQVASTDEAVYQKHTGEHRVVKW